MQAPELFQPAQGATVPVMAQFSWRSVPGASSYLFCMSRPGIACPTHETDTSDTIVIRRPSGVTFAAPNTLRFNNQTMHWTAAACGATGACAYQQNVRAANVSFSAPKLGSAYYSVHPPYGWTFSWNRVPGAQFYLFCLSRTQTPCPTNPVDTPDTIVVLRPGNQPTRAVLSDLFRFSDQTVYWTAAACAARGVCFYQSNLESLDVPARPPPRPVSSSSGTGSSSSSSGSSVSGQGTASSSSSTSSSPDFEIEVTPSTQSIEWGQSASYTVTVRSKAGFNQPVALAFSNLPDGARSSFSQSTLTPGAGGSATATFTLSTTLAAARPGKTTFRVSGAGPANRTHRDEAEINILRQAGGFGGNVYPLRSANASCPPAAATIVAGPSVRFTSPLGATNPSPDFGAGYDFSPKCRVGFVIPPLGAEPFVNLYNLGFDPAATGAGDINTPYNFPSLAVDARFSPDDSIVALVGPGQVAGQASIVVHDIVLRTSSAPEFFVGAISSIDLETTPAGQRARVALAGGQTFTVNAP